MFYQMLNNQVNNQKRQLLLGTVSTTVYFFNFQNVTYIQNEGFPTAVLGTGTVTAATRAFAVQGGESKYYSENGLVTIQ